MLKYFGLHPSPTANPQQGLEKNENTQVFSLITMPKLKLNVFYVFMCIKDRINFFTIADVLHA